jgi:3-hydroxybutyryl-CoA dehydrogenase
MGHGIAQVAATAGYKVLLRDVDRESLSRGIQAIERNLAKGMQLGKLTEADCDSTLQHIRGTTHLEEIANADLVIEAAPERLELKQEILRDVESHAGKAFIFATNTSSLSITEIAKASERPAQVVGMHFFNPVHLMRLVEIVVGKATGDDTVEIVRQVTQRLRKE